MKILRKLFLGGLLSGAGYLMFTKKGQEISKEMKAKAPALMKEVKLRYSKGKKTLDEVISEVVEEWENARDLMKETAAPMKREIKRRMKK